MVISRTVDGCFYLDKNAVIRVSLILLTTLKMSDVRRVALEVKWRIENAESWLQKRDDTLYSPQFLAETLGNTRWKLCLSPNWQLSEKYVRLTLQRDIEDDGPKLIDLNYEFSFTTCDGSPLKSESCTKKFGLKTVSQELNVKQTEILEEKKEAYLPEGVLTVCCKLWNNWPTVSKRQCSFLRSVIGTKGINLNATVDNINLSSYAVANFLIPSADNNMISLDVYLLSAHQIPTRHHEFVFKRNHVECKSSICYSFALFALGTDGYKYKFKQICDLSEKTLSKIYDRNSYTKIGNYLPNNTLTLQLEVSYHPGVKSECTETEFTDCENSQYTSTDLVDVLSSDSKRVPSSNSDGLPPNNMTVEKGRSSDEDESSYAAGMRCLPLTTLKEDIASLHEDRFFCDMKLQTNTETFPAHRCVLSVRSPVFKKMFTTGMKEKAGECINVPDISSDTVRRMLQFLYTDCTGDLEMQSAKDLYIASDKYDIALLKQRCSSFMKENLCPANVCEVLVLADMHHDKDLESAAEEYVLDNDEEVFYSDEWKLFMKNYSGLAARVMYLKCTKSK